MADAAYDFGEAVGRIAKLTVDVAFYADRAAAVTRADERTILCDAQDAATRRLAAAMVELNARLQALAPGSREDAR